MSDSSPPPPSSTGREGALASAPPSPWRLHLTLFVATALSVFVTATLSDPAAGLAMEAQATGGLAAVVAAPFRSREAVLHGAQFCGALLTILTAHELGHYFAAKLHRVDASLPFFIPMPLLSPFGTMGAVIRMRGTIKTRRALLDIGAAGPLAGLAFAIPMYLWGAAHSTLVPVGGPGLQLGESILMRVLDRVAAPAVPEGMDLSLSPVAFAAWGGMFVTMINLIPASQLDGGHVAYALFGRKQDAIARWVHRSMLAFFLVSVVSFALRDYRAGRSVVGHMGESVEGSIFWLVWFEMLAILGTMSQTAERATPGEPRMTVRMRLLAVFSLVALAGVGGESGGVAFWVLWFGAVAFLVVLEARFGALMPRSRLLDHPPTRDEPLGPVRAAVAVVTLLFFALLFMPTPIHM